MRYIIGVLGVVLVAIFAVLMITSRGPSDTANKVTTPGIIKMTSFADKSSIVSLTIRGRLVGDTEYRAVRVSITPSERRVEVLSGYDENVIKSQSYPNTQSGYTDFLHAMDRYGFSRTKKPLVTDSRGVCPLGNQYSYVLTSGVSKPVDTWSTSCGTSDGTFAGTANVIRQLFQLQIPDYSQQISGVRL